MSLEGKSVVITGGAGDIGQATARRLASAGAHVYLLDTVVEPRGLEIAKAVSAGAQYIRCDVTQRAEVERSIAQIGKVHIAIVNAGIVRAGAFLDLSVADWIDTLNVNLTGAFHTAQVAARVMVRQLPDEQGIRGRIFFSGSWVQDMPHPGTFAYITSKGGLKMLARTMAQELAQHRVLVNIVAPGAVQAGLTKQLADKDENFRREILEAVPLGSFQTAESVAGAFAFLCSDDASYMTGSTMLIDGGLSLVRYE